MNNPVKKIIFFVQGEGRGHMTQAISMYDTLIKKGHRISAVVIGSGGINTTPAFFFERIKAPIVKLRTPNFVTDKNNKSIKVVPTLIQSISNLNTYHNSLRLIRLLLEEHKPDLVINFYDVLIGLYYSLNKCKIPMVSIAHQYIYLHPDFVFPKGHLADRWSVYLYTRLTSAGSKKRLALSLYPLKQVKTKENVVVVPPLLRNEVLSLKTEKKNFYLVYLVNGGYMADIIKWHKNNTHIELHCFADVKKIEGKINYEHENFGMHQISDKEFLEKMSEARGLVSTAGFESICEAMYLGKPVLMVPVEGHYEQFCNARDAFDAGAGIYDSWFNINKLVQYTEVAAYENNNFKRWATNSAETIYKEITHVLNSVHDAAPSGSSGQVREAMG